MGTQDGQEEGKPSNECKEKERAHSVLVDVYMVSYNLLLTYITYGGGFLFSLLQRIKRKLVGEEGRCRCYERQRVKA